MENFISFLHTAKLGQVVILTGVFVLTLMLLLLIRRVIWHRLTEHAQRKESGWDYELLKVLNLPSKYLVVIGAVAIAATFAPSWFLTSQTIKYFLTTALTLGVAWAVYRVVALLLRASSSPLKLTHTSRALFLTITRIVIFTLTLLVVLGNLGVSITPLLASLGVGSVAVALALQDTLSNFFSGIYILIDEPIRIGDFVQTEAGLEGYVTKIGWRSTHIRLLANNIAVIPNSKIASQRLTNYDLEDKEISVSMQMGVAYGSDLEKVERITIEVATEIMARVEGGIPNYKPSISYHTFNSSSIDFSVIMRAKQAVDQYRIKHEFIKAVYKRYNQEGISIPFPQQDVHIIGEVQA